MEIKEKRFGVWVLLLKLPQKLSAKSTFLSETSHFTWSFRLLSTPVFGVWVCLYWALESVYP